jgi:hypothetical protein
MNKKASIDRFEGNIAIVIVSEENKQYLVNKSDLPKGAKEGDWLSVEISGEKITKMEIDIQAKEESEKRIQSKLDSLRRGDQLKK